MDVEIHLLGSPRVVRDGAARRDPRGHKVWGLLAYLLLRDAPPTRAHVAGAAVPGRGRSARGAALGAVDAAPAAGRRPPRSGATRCGSPGASTPVGRRAGGPGGGPGARSRRSPTSTTTCWSRWRSRAARRSRSGSRRSAGTPAARPRRCCTTRRSPAWPAATPTAAPTSPRGSSPSTPTTRTPRCCSSARSRSAAAAWTPPGRPRRAATLFRTDLGVEPGPALDAALASSTATPTARAAGGRAAVRALIEAGEAAVGGRRAGGRPAVPAPGRRGRGGARRRRAGRAQRCARSARRSCTRRAGRDEEGVTSLHRALAWAGAEPRHGGARAGELALRRVPARPLRPRGGVARAGGRGATDPAQRAAALTVRGSTLSDAAGTRRRSSALREAFDVAQDERRRAYVAVDGRPGAPAARRARRGRRGAGRVGRPGVGGGLDRVPALAAGAARGGRPAARRRRRRRGPASSTPSPWAARSATRAGRGWRPAGSGSCTRREATSTRARRHAARRPAARRPAAGRLRLGARVRPRRAGDGRVAAACRTPRSGWPNSQPWPQRCGMAELAARAAVHRWRLGDPAGAGRGAGPGRGGGQPGAARAARSRRLIGCGAGECHSGTSPASSRSIRSSRSSSARSNSALAWSSDNWSSSRRRSGSPACRGAVVVGHRAPTSVSSSPVRSGAEHPRPPAADVRAGSWRTRGRPRPRRRR